MTRMTVREDMVNGHAMAHGGLVFTLADTAFACACNSFGPVTVAAVGRDRVRRAGPARRRPGGRGGAAHPVRAGPALRRDRAARRRRHRRVPRPQPPRPASVDGGGQPGGPPPRPARLRPGVAARGGGRGVQRARLRRHQHGGPGGPARHRQVGHLPPRARARRSCSGWPWTGRWTGCSRSRPSRRTGRPGHRAAGAPGPRQRRGARRASCRTSPCCCGCAATPRSSGRRWSAGASSTGSSPTWCARPRATATCGPTSTRRSPPGCCSAWSTRWSSGTGRHRGAGVAGRPVCAVAFDGLRAGRPEHIRSAAAQ